MTTSPELKLDYGHPSQTIPLLTLAVGILLASTSSIFIRFAQQEAASIVIASYRMLFATLILLPFALTRYRTEFASHAPRQWLLTIIAGVFLGAHFGTWISSLAYTSVASSVVLVQTSPLFVMLLSPLLLGEKPARRAMIGLMLALTGGLVIAVSDVCGLPLDAGCLNLSSPLTEGSALIGDGLAIAGAITGGLYLLVGRSVRKSMPLMPYITVVYGVAALTLLLVALINRLAFTGYSPRTYLWLLLLALFPQLLAHSIYNWSLKYLPATTVSLSLLGEPVAAAILAYLFLNETLPALRWVGAIMIFAGIALALIRSNQALQAAPEIDTIEG
jgi:drug/metabolite transporter (DMT)-like permease